MQPSLSSDSLPAITPGLDPAPAVSSLKPLIKHSFLRSIFRHQFLWVLTGSFLLAALYGRVVLLNLITERVPGVVGGVDDGYDNVWNNWWVKTALLDLHRSPLYSDYIYYPLGASLRFHTLNPLNGLLTLPFNLIFGYLPVLNLFLVLAPVATLFCAFLLIRDQIGNTGGIGRGSRARCADSNQRPKSYGDSWAAFAGAALFTYANQNVLFFFSLGQTNLITMHWLPLYLFFMLRALHGRTAPPVRSETGARMGRDPQDSLQASLQGGLPRGSVSRRWTIYAAFAVAALVAMSLTDWQYVMYAIFVTLLYFLFILVTPRSWAEKGAIFARLAAIGGVYAAVVAVPLVIPMIQEAAASPWLIVSGESVWHSTDLVFLLGPGLGNPGYLAVGVAAIGLWVCWKRGGRERQTGLFWGSIALLFYLITLGPKLTVNGQVTDIPLLYGLIQNLPVLNIGRDPGRFNIVALLGISMLVAFGLRTVFEFVTRSLLSARNAPQAGVHKRMNSNLSNVPAAPAGEQYSELIIPGLVVVTFLSVALFGFMAAIGPATKVDAADWPAFYQEIAQDKEQYAILELPIYPATGQYNMYQVMHEKLRFVSWLARDHKQGNPNSFVQTASLFRHFWMVNAPLHVRDLAYPQQDFLTHTDYATQGIPILNFYNTRYIVLYKDAIGPADWSGYNALLSQVLGKGVKPYRDEKLVRVYKVPCALPPANPLTLDVGNGWFHSEVDKAGHVFRWADNSTIDPYSGLIASPVSELYTMNLRKEAVRAELSFTALTWKVPRSLKVTLNGQEVASLELKPEDPAKRVTVEMSMPSSNNRIVFSSPEPPQPTGNPNDTRLLSFGMYDVSLQAIPGQNSVPQAVVGDGSGACP